MAPAETTVRDREAAGRPLPAPGGLRRPASAFCQAWKGDDRGARGRLWDEGRRPPFRDVRPTAGDGDRGAMEKRAIFGGKVLPYLLLAPQLLITFVFFYWPANQALWQSFLLQDAFGLRT